MGLRVETDENGVPFVQLGKHQLRLDLEELSGIFKEQAVKELNETPERIEQGLEKLRQLVQDEKNLNVPLEREFLIKYLRPFKFRAEMGFKMMKKFYKFKCKHPKYAENVTPEVVKHVFDNEVFVFLPTRTHDGARLMIINAGAKWDPKEVKLEDMFKAVMVAIEIAMLEPKTQVSGVHVILNLQGLSLTHVYQFSPHMAKLMVDWVQECAPVRLRGIHIVNQPYIFNMLYAIFKPFLGEYLKKRLSFHGTDMASLTERINPECLPEYFGGCAGLPEYHGSLFSDMLFYYEDTFKLFNSYGYVTGKQTTVD